jgi:hypothetical protein
MNFCSKIELEIELFWECFMSPTVHHLPLNMNAIMAAADTNGTGVALTECPAEFVSFQRQPANLPPAQNVISVAVRELPARQFSGKYAIFATNAVTTATFVAFRSYSTERISDPP